MKTRCPIHSLAALLLTLTLAGCLQTDDPVWSATNSKPVPALQGRWYSVLQPGDGAVVTLLPNGEYKLQLESIHNREINGTAYKAVLVPLQDNFYVLQACEIGARKCRYPVLQLIGERAEIRVVDTSREDIQRSALKHGMQGDYGTADGEMGNLFALRRLSKSDIVAFLRQTIASGGLFQSSGLDRLIYSRTPPTVPANKSETPHSQAPAPQPEPKASPMPTPQPEITPIRPRTKGRRQEVAPPQLDSN